MELRIKPFPKNIYPKKGLLIKSSSPLVWLREMEFLGINLNQIKSFAIPSNEPNVLYGCFLIFNHLAPDEIGKNAYFQSVQDKLFIPENTIFYPQIIPEEWREMDAEYLIMHPDFGLVKLSAEIDWLDVIENPVEDNSTVRKPSNGVKIPQKIENYTVEMDDERVLEALQKPKTDEEWMKDLPFDMKKVMAGNKKEIEKYLKYIEQHPDRIVDLGVPLDVMGTSRGDGFGKFTFDNGWLKDLFGGGQNGRDTGGFSNGQNGSEKRSYFWIFWVILIIASIIRFALKWDKMNSSPQESEAVTNSTGNNSGKISKIPSDPLMFESGVTEIDIKIDSIYREKRDDLSRELSRAQHVYSANDESIIEDHKAKGGRSLETVENDIAITKNKMRRSKDSLKRIYKKKIAKQVESNAENYQRKIADSIKKANNGRPADKGIVRSVWNKKQILMIDSLGHYYGTKEEPDLPVIHDGKDNLKALENSSPKNNTSFMEIIWLIAFMIGAVGIYNYLVRRNYFDLGGGDLPVGVKVLLVVILLGMLIYIFYPLINMFGYNWFVWLLIVCVVVVLYRLFSKDKTILKSDKNG
ncbi:hypothetical protein ACM39_12715 [Chryseobacterium sp. FH2]|uniref:hypothetical protein n=1 Tax=Chryseobacterium sp. FH2 TaxID=1674291 RepID=UPI00065A9D94|nr:hypothetical protein [Chryseobacterium sp. FH2]KMQ67708.1 hypothetical protein ACM39_12715 [Chryseobacterium sp. FH2]